MAACVATSTERGRPSATSPSVSLVTTATPTNAPSAAAGAATASPPSPRPSSALPSVAVPSAALTTAAATASAAATLGSPSQTRVPGSVPPSPGGLPATDGCLTYGVAPPFVGFADCVVHGLPPDAPVTLTANGSPVFLRIGRTTVYPDGSWYFAWSETQHVTIVFVVTAGGVSRSLTQTLH